MKAICCDRCHEFARIEGQSLVPDGKWRNIDGGTASFSDPCNVRPEILLCPSCASAFDRFMAQPEVYSK